LTPGRTVSCYVSAPPPNPSYPYSLTLTNGTQSCTRSGLSVSR
jgi:hypothetical protein